MGVLTWMLPLNEFIKYRPKEPDKYKDIKPEIKVGDLKKAFTGTPKLSYLISTWNRSGQLARSLECLARQEWRNFEVLIMDDGSTENLQPIFDIFRDYLQLRTFRWERGDWRSCPSRAFKFMIREAKGSVIAISHPEMMLHSTAMKYLYNGYRKEIDAYYGVIDSPQVKHGEWYWVSLKPNFIHEDMYETMDVLVDWHSNLDNIQGIPRFAETGGFAAMTNSWHEGHLDYPWWFVGSAKKDCPIWEDMPIFDGHGILDMWMMSYRRIKRIVDVVPQKVLCYHQPHQTVAVSPEGEQDSEKAKVK